MTEQSTSGHFGDHSRVQKLLQSCTEKCATPPHVLGTSTSLHVTSFNLHVHTLELIQDVSQFPQKPVPIPWMLYKATQYSVMFRIASSYSIAI